MALRKGVFVAICAIGIAKSLLPLDASEQHVAPRPLTAAEQARHLTSPTSDFVGDAMSAIMLATACDDGKLAAKAKRTADAALAAKGLKPAHDMLAEAKALLDSQPTLKKSMARDCPRALKSAEARLDGRVK